MKTLHAKIISIVICFSFILNINAQSWLSKDLIAYYPFNFSANDVSGHGLNGVNHNGIISVDRFGMIQSAYYLNGTDAYISINDDSLLHTKNLTISMWLRFNDRNGKAITQYFGKAVGASYIDSYGIWNESSSGFSASIGEANNWGDILNIGNDGNGCDLSSLVWHNVVYIFNDDADYEALYIDGIKCKEATTSKSIAYDNHPITIGADNETGSLSFFFEGSVDDIAIYGRALNEKEIKSLYKGQLNFSSIYPATVYPGDSIHVDYCWKDFVDTSATISLQMSDSNFGSYIVLGSTKGDSCGTISGIIPANHVKTCQSKYRITSDNPLATPACNLKKQVDILSHTEHDNDYVLELNGTSSSVELGNWLNKQQFSISMWIKPDATQQMYADIMDNNHSAGTNWVIQQGDISKPNDYQFGAGFSIQANLWQNVILTCDATGMRKAYVDGKLVGSLKMDTINYNGNQFLRIGSWGGGGRNWKGQLDDLQIWDHALSSAEIKSTRATEIKGNESGLLGLWTMNFLCNTDSLIDASKNKHNGVLKNGAKISKSTRQLFIVDISKHALYPGDSVQVLFFDRQIFTSANTFTLQLSDETGSFTNPVNIGTVKATQSGLITGKIPMNIKSGCNYLIRIISSDPVITGSTSAQAIQILNVSAAQNDYVLKLDGADDYVDLGPWFNYQAFSISMWIKPDSGQQQYADIMDNNHSAGNNWAIQQLNSVDNYYEWYSPANYKLDHDKWQFLTLTNDTDGTRRVYLYGIEVDSAIKYGKLNYDGKQFLRIGKWGGGTRNWKGKLDDVQIWDRPLSASEIASNMNATLTGNEFGLVAYYNMNDICNNTVIEDKTTNQHNGLLVNNPKREFSDIEKFNPQVIPNRGGNINIVSVKIIGHLFQPDAVIKLVNTSNPEIIGDSVQVNSNGTEIFVLFNLTGKTAGKYDIQIINPDTTTIVYPDIFTVTAGEKPQLWIDITGRPYNAALPKIKGGKPNAVGTYTPIQVRMNKPSPQQIIFGNKGNVDAKGVTMWVVMDTCVKIENEKQFSNPYTADGIDYNAIPTWFITDSIKGEKRMAKIIPLYIPLIPAGSTQSITLKTTSAYPYKLEAYFNPPYYSSPFSANMKACLSCNASNLFDNIVGECISNAASTYMDFNNFIMKSTLTNGASFMWNLAKTVNSCNPNPAAKLANAAMKIAKGLNNLKDKAECMASCGEAMSDLVKDKTDVEMVNAMDPNEKVGPRGLTADNYYMDGVSYNYSIYFENKDSATAAAQEVSIIDTLDKNKFDFKTFSFSTFGWSGASYGTNANFKTNMVQEIDMRPAKPYIVRISGNLDTITGRLTFSFITLDTLTMQLTEDAIMGFLPPNKNTPEGEGFVSYSVMPKSGLTTGTEIKNKSLIVFDNNTPIATNEWKVKIDNSKPISKVVALPAISDTAFWVVLSGDDVGGGIYEYNLYYSIDSITYYKYVQTTNDSVLFTGGQDTTYYFYCIAKDAGMNIENKSVHYETYTKVCKTLVKPVLPFGTSTTLCAGDSALYVTNSVKHATTYNWFITPTNSGTVVQNDTTAKINFNANYSGNSYLQVQAQDECREIKSDSLEIIVHANPVVYLGEDVTTGYWDYITLDAGAGMSNYLWNDSSTERTKKASWNGIESTNNISVIVTNNFGCKATDSIIITFEVTPGINNIDKTPFSINPNPASQSLVISIKRCAELVETSLVNKDTEEKITITNNLGQTVFSQQLNNSSPQQLNIDISQYQSGIYFVRIGNTVEKLIINK